MQASSFSSETWLPKPQERIFSFFANARNLEIITPPWLHFQILTQGSILMQEGALIDYRISLRGIPLRWRSRIEVWEPPRRFVDVQIRGPYRLWRHEHFFDTWEDGTLCLDRVRYTVPGGALIDHLFVRRDIKEIFEFRRNKLLELFAASPTPTTESGFDQADCRQSGHGIRPNLNRRLVL